MIDLQSIAQQQQQHSYPLRALQNPPAVTSVNYGRTLVIFTGLDAMVAGARAAWANKGTETHAFTSSIFIFGQAIMSS